MPITMQNPVALGVCDRSDEEIHRRDAMVAASGEFALCPLRALLCLGIQCRIGQGTELRHESIMVVSRPGGVARLEQEWKRRDEPTLHDRRRNLPKSIRVRLGRLEPRPSRVVDEESPPVSHPAPNPSAALLPPQSDRSRSRPATRDPRVLEAMRCGAHRSR